MDDFEINLLDFNKAKEIDKRTFSQIYFSILKREHIILFTFFNWKNYNLFYIKFSKFFFILSTIMAMNVFFFFDKSIHMIYEKKGKYIFVTLFPQIVYSIMITYFAETISNSFTMIDKKIYQIKNLENNETNKTIVIKILSGIKCKLTVFFVFIFILMAFYWYLITAFCSVYRNTQSIYLLNLLVSFIIYSIYPFIIYAFTSAFRLCGLKRNSSCFYKISTLIPIF